MRTWKTGQMTYNMVQCHGGNCKLGSFTICLLRLLLKIESQALKQNPFYLLLSWRMLSDSDTHEHNHHNENISVLIIKA